MNVNNEKIIWKTAAEEKVTLIVETLLSFP